MSWAVKFWTEKVLPNVPRIIQRNFWRLLFSFLFAFLLFNLVHKNVREETEYRMVTINDVEISFVPETENGKPEAIMLVPLKVKPTVSVTLSVPVYDDVKSRDLYLECPVTKKQIDENAPVFLDAENLKLRRSLYFREPKIHPPALSLDLDYYVEKNVPVKPYYDPNEILNGYRLEKDPEPVDVSFVKISGPKKVLAGITQLKTDKIPLANKTQGFTCTVDLVLPFEARNSDVKVFSDAVQVNVKIRRNGVRTFDRIPVRVLEGIGGANNLVIAEIRPETVSVTVEDAPEGDFLDPRKIEELSPDQIHAVLDLSGVKDAGQYHDRIRFWSDDDQFRVISVEPRNASVKLVPASSLK